MVHELTLEAESEVEMATIRSILGSIKIDTGSISRIKIEIESDDPLRPNESKEEEEATETGEEEDSNGVSTIDDIDGLMDDIEMDDDSVEVHEESDMDTVEEPPSPWDQSVEEEEEVTTDAGEDEEETESDSDEEEEETKSTPYPRLTTDSKQFRPAAILYTKDGYFEASQLAHMVEGTDWDMSGSAMSSHLYSLLKKDIVHREKEDKNPYQYQLTQLGRDTIDHVIDGEIELPEGIGQDVPDEEDEQDPEESELVEENEDESNDHDAVTA